MNPKVDPTITKEVQSCLPVRRDAVMIFGSAARHDMTPFSDVDVLVLRRGKTETVKFGRVNISFYHPSHLQKLASEGSLFIRHLLMDGIILEDTNGLLESCLSLYQKPSSYEPFKAALSAVLPIFDVNQIDYKKRARGFMDTAIFCLRTLLYIKADERDSLCFSLRKLEQFTHWPSLRLLLKYKESGTKLRWNDFSHIVEAIECELDKKCINNALTIEAYLTNNYDRHPLIMALSLRLLAGENLPANYDLFSPISIVS